MDRAKLVEFKAFLAYREITAQSIANNIRGVEMFFRVYPDLTFENLQTYVFDNLEKYRHSYLNKIIFGCRLYATCFKMDDRIQKFKPLKKQPFAKAILSVEEIKAFFELKPQKNESRRAWRRYQLFFKVCAMSGMRTGEVAHLEKDQLDFGRHVFVLESTKTNKPRLVPIAPQLETELKEFVSDSLPRYIFSPAGSKSPINDSDWHRHFHVRIKRLGIERKNLSPYSLRHSFITRLLEEDVNIFKVQKIVGHNNFQTTYGYTHLTVKDIQKALSKDPLGIEGLPPEKVIDEVYERLQLMACSFTRHDLRHELSRDGNSLHFRISVS